MVALQVTRQLRMDGWPALSIHGDKSQQERDWVLAEFKQNKSPIMLATDVAARGLGRTKLDCTLCIPACSLQSEDHMLVQMCTSFALCL
jgi:superfamily II DNA/RNA helicase